MSLQMDSQTFRKKKHVFFLFIMTLIFMWIGMDVLRKEPTVVSSCSSSEIHSALCLAKREIAQIDGH